MAPALAGEGVRAWASQQTASTNPPGTADGKGAAYVPASLYRRPPVVTRRHACPPPAVVSAACAVATIQLRRALQAFWRIRVGGLAAGI